MPVARLAVARALHLVVAATVIAACAPPPPPPPESPRIHQIQGAAARSPRDGQPVSGVPGVVTALRSNGFYLQDTEPDADDATSEAVFVFTNGPPSGVVVGDRLEVSAAVAEFTPGGAAGADNLSTTQLVTPSWRVLSRGSPTPAPVVLGQRGRSPPSRDLAVGVAFFESLEGMLVQLDDAVVVGPRNRFGEIVVLADAGRGGDAGLRTGRGGILLRADDPNPERVLLDDELLANREPMPSADVGDRLAGPLVGVLDYSFGNYKLELLRPPRVERAGQPRTVLPAARPDQLSVGTFNVENLHPGAAPERLAALAGLIVRNMAAPDLVALEEIQDSTGPRDDATVSAVETYARLTAAIRAAGGPVYDVRQVDPENNRDGGEPGGNIRVAFMFRTDRGLRFVDRPGGDATTPVGIAGGRLSASPGRVDPRSPAWQGSRKPLAAEVEWRGRRLVAVANHFVSKGADAPLFGRHQPPPRPSESQRVAQATVVHAFVGRLLEADPDANVVVLGDLNDFAWSPTLTALKGSHLHNLTDDLPEPERYGYVFDGNSQALDHVLVSGALRRAGPEHAIVHANAEYADRASDHDPQVVRFTLP
jgi:predicted extracellular nuclease